MHLPLSHLSNQCEFSRLIPIAPLAEYPFWLLAVGWMLLAVWVAVE
jgi:hypothetical protein